MTDFFINYTSVDRLWAEWIAWQLETAGYTTVNQAWDFRPGANFALAMQHAATESERTIAVLSPAYLQSGFTAAEWAAAFARDPTATQGLLLPVRIQDCEPRGLLPQIAYIDLVGLEEEVARDTLLAGVRRQRAKPTREPGFPDSSPRPSTTPPLFPRAIPATLGSYRTQITSGDEQFRRHRTQMLEKVRHIWIKGLLEPSLSQRARIELGLETKPYAVDRSFDLLIQRPKQAPQSIPIGTPISQIYTDSGNVLLILGEPGAGKTTLLLELTRDLLKRAQQDERHLIPVVFSLSSWAEQRLALADWIVDELIKRYDVPHKLAKAWIDDELILPLLDGLDLVADYRLEACVETINAFLSEHGLLPLVVCSRTAEYEMVRTRLRLQEAVVIQPLTHVQIDLYLAHNPTHHASVSEVLHNDSTLWELLDTPRALDILISSCTTGVSATKALTPRITRSKIKGRWTSRFAAYVDHRLGRRSNEEQQTLDLSEMGLTSLSESIGNLTQLRTLNLSNNRLSSLPESLVALSQLQQLYLHGNEQLGIPPEILGPTAQEVNRYQQKPTTPTDILSYYFRIRNEPRTLNEAKLILC